MTEKTLTTTQPAEVDIRPATAYLASLRTDVSRAGMRSELNKIARVVLHISKDDARPDDWQRIPWQSLNAANVRAIMNTVGGKPASRNKTLAALRGVAMRAHEMGLMDVDTWQRIGLIKSETVQRDDETVKGRMMEAWELAALMRVCAHDPSPAGIRDAALIALAAKTGARRAELAAMNLANVATTAEGYEIKVTMKRKTRTLFVDGGAAKALADWLAVRGTNVGDDAPLFVRISQTGIISEKGMSTTAVHKILVKRTTEAGVMNLHWHDYRRTFGTTLLDNGEDVSTVQKLMGHSDPKTTVGYDRRPAESRRKAARKISVPYFKRVPAVVE